MPLRTPSGKKTAVADVEGKLSKEYGEGNARVFATLNKIGLMRGSKVTPKGARAAKGAGAAKFGTKAQPAKKTRHYTGA